MNTEKAKGFIVHGVRFRGERTNQLFGECPFCGGSDKFHCNKDSLLWDCKKCGKRGNFQIFLEEICKQNVEDLDEEFLNRLASERKLPPEAFRNIELGRAGMSYTFPIRDAANKITDLRIYKFGSKVRGTATCSTGLWNLQTLRKSPENWPVYICEGEWDGIAFRWLLKFLRQVGVVVAVPGANVFKREWIHHFENRHVIVLYDNDEAGEQGEQIIKERIGGTAKSIKYLHWSQKLPPGYDIRDLIATEAVKHKKPRKTFKIIKMMLKDDLRKAPALKALEQKSEEPQDIPEKKNREDVFNAFKKYLFLRNYEPIDVMLAVAVSNKIEGDPLWMFLVSPPGGSKTEILSALNLSPDVYTASSLTPHSLISGATFTGSADPSLIPKLNGKILSIKDFTSILSKRDQEKDEIFGILRDAFDGSCSKIFGNGVRRAYNSRFTIIAAVTPKIYEVGQEHQSLGERFLKYSIGNNLLHVSEEEIILRAINNLNKETKMREEIAQTVRGFLYHIFKDFDPEKIPMLPGGIKIQIAALAQFAARMRGTVSRERYRPDMVMSKPFAEVGSRLGKQFAKAAHSLAIVRGKQMVSQDEYAVVRKIALDTISQRNEEIIRVLYKEAPKRGGSIRTRELSSLTKYPHATISRLMADMQMLEVVTRVGRANKYEWRLSDYMLDQITKAGLYRSDAELNRQKIEPEKKLIVRKQI